MTVLSGLNITIIPSPSFIVFDLRPKMKKKGKGLSFDQKRDKMLKIFHDSVRTPIFRKVSSTMSKSKSYPSRQGSLFLVSRKYSIVLRLTL